MAARASWPVKCGRGGIVTRKAALCAFICFLPALVSIGSAAQENSCRALIYCAVYSLYNAGCVPVPPPGAHSCFTAAPFEAGCEIPTYQCSTSPCPSCNGGQAAVPIELATGNTYVQESDVVVPGLGGGLTLTRTWNSVPGTTSYGMFGHQWSSTFEEQVFIGSDYMIKHSRGDGSLWTYGFAMIWGPTGDTPVFWTAAPRSGGATLVFNGTYATDTGIANGSWTMTLRNGEHRTFSQWYVNDPFFHLSSISDRNGNTTLLSYDATTHLVASVTDAASRHLYFSYGSIAVGGIAVTVVTNVTSDFGVSLSYQYDTMANLIKVIKPDGTFVSFEYSPAGLLTAVKDSSGRILESHTYDGVGRGLTSSRSGGVDSVTVSY